MTPDVTKMDKAKDTLNLLQTDGGHIVIACSLMFVGLYLHIHWKMDLGKEMFFQFLGILGYALKK